MDTGNLLCPFQGIDIPILWHHNSNGSLLRMRERVTEFDLEGNCFTCGNGDLIRRDTGEKTLRAKVGDLRQHFTMQAVELLRVRSNLLEIRRCHS